jgi:hypothetical protein
MDDGDTFRRVRMRVVLGRLAMGGPAGVPDARMACERQRLQPRFEILQFAFGAPPLDMGAFQRRHAGRVVTAIFETFERIDQLIGDRSKPKNSDNAAHAVQYP